MRHPKHLTALSLLSLICLLAACGSDAPAPVSPEPVSLQAQYSSAVADARTVTPAEISRYLTPITNENPDLIWENGVVGSRLLVVTWLGDAGKYYKCRDPNGCSGNSSCIEGGECPTYRYDSWVTVVPEIKNFFGPAQPESLRIAQLLGLPQQLPLRVAQASINTCWKCGSPLRTSSAPVPTRRYPILPVKQAFPPTRSACSTQTTRSGQRSGLSMAFSRAIPPGSPIKQAIPTPWRRPHIPGPVSAIPTTGGAAIMSA